MKIRRWVGQLFPHRPDRTIFYLHLPKTGGTSIARALTGNRRNSLLVSEKAETKQQVIDRLDSIPPRARQSIRYVAGHRVFTELQYLFPGEPVFATSIRHPIDLYVSLYNFWIDLALDPGHEHYQRNQEMMMRNSTPLSLSDWLESSDEWLHMYARVLARAESGPEAPGIPLPNVSQDDIDNAKRFLKRCDFILEVTQSQVDIPRFCHFCGIVPPRKRSRVSIKHAVVPSGSTTWKNVETIIQKRSESDFEIYAFALECRKTSVQLNNV